MSAPHEHKFVEVSRWEEESAAFPDEDLGWIVEVDLVVETACDCGETDFEKTTLGIRPA